MGGWSDALEAPPGEAFKAEQASDGFTLEPVARFSSFFQEYFPTLHNQRESGLHRDEYLWLQPDQIGFSKFGSTHTGD